MTHNRELIGYTEREEGWYAMYAAQPGAITTAAFILCKYCRAAIAAHGGPRYDAVCIPCHDKEPELR